MHKYIKRILFFLSILLLQFSFGDNLVGSSSTESFNISIEFSEQFNPVFLEHGFRENHIFEHSFYEVVSCRSIYFCGGYADLVESWKILNETGIEGLAGKVDNIEIVDDFVKKYPDKVDELNTTLKEVLYPEGILLSVKKFEEITTIKNTDDLIDVLSNVTDVNTIFQLEQKGVKSFFRGTTRSKVDGSLFPGNPNSQLGGISTSTDPIRGTIFSIESATANPSFNGVLQMGLPVDLGDLKLIAPNRRVKIELEAILKASADDFANLSKVEISVEDARKLVKEVYDIDLPSSIDSDLSRELLENLDASSLEKSLEFYQKAIKFNLK